MTAVSGLSKKAPTQKDAASYLRAFKIMLQARIVEDKLASLYRAGGKIVGGVFIGKGQEALSVSLAINLRKGDLYAPLIRDQAGRLAFGDTILDTFRTYLGSSLGSMRGRDGNVHRGRPREGYYPMISHLGTMISVVCGGLMARRFRGESGVVGAACLGDGATSTGSFHEGLNLAAVEKLPFVLVVANNQYAYSTPTKLQFACEDLYDKAVGYGVAGHRVDGTDLSECLRVVGDAVQAARSGRGPQLVVASLLRLMGHGEHDDPTYIDAALKKSPLGQDCLLVSEKFILKQGWASETEIAGWKEQIDDEVDTIAARVQREPAPDPDEEEWTAISTESLREHSTES